MPIHTLGLPVLYIANKFHLIFDKDLSGIIRD